jgi:uncharacterized iron-regulated membrane protein
VHARKLLNWKTFLIYLHRWTGIVFGLIFVVWFISGVAMIYVGMPHLSVTERLGHMPALDLSAVNISPAEGAARHDLAPARLRIEMFYDGRPIYRFPDGTKVYADTGDLVAGASREEALELVRRWVPQFAGSVTYDGYLTQSDQWTLYSDQRAAMPLHRIDLGDPAGTQYYVSEKTGEPTMKTDRRGRILGYVSAVLHWTYFTKLRWNTALWIELVGWGAVAGAIMCIAGMIVGFVRLGYKKLYRLRSGPSYSPYSGWMKWHHYAGIIFGIVTTTWAFSGAVSLSRPFPSIRNAPATDAQRTAIAGSALELDAVTIDRMQAALATFAPSFVPKQIDVHQFRGQPYFIGYRPPGAYSYEEEIGANEEQYEPRPEHLLVPVAEPAVAFKRFEDDRMWDVAKAAMPGVPIRDAAWLQEYDAYYYNQDGTRPLPVLRVRYDDERSTWLYLDPNLGTMMKQDVGGRWNRWLYHGLHNLDFPIWYYRRPLWDIGMILLSIGGLVLSATTLLPSWRRLVRHARRAAGALAPVVTLNHDARSRVPEHGWSARVGMLERRRSRDGADADPASP